MVQSTVWAVSAGPPAKKSKSEGEKPNEHIFKTGYLEDHVINKAGTAGDLFGLQN